MKRAIFPQSFFTCFYPLTNYLKREDGNCKVLAYILKHMDRNNMLEISNRELAKKLKLSEDSICKKLKNLMLEGIIHKDRKKIMLSPAYAVKTRPQRYPILANMWYNGIFRPYVSEDEQTTISIDASKIEELIKQAMEQ